MNRISRFSLTLALLATLAIGACGDDADTDTSAIDSTAGDDSMSFTPADTGLPTNADSNSTAGPDSTGESGAVRPDSADNTPASSPAGGTNSELASLVEAQLMTWPGLSDVKFTAQSDGTVELTGSVATAQDKSDAEAEVKKIPGVKSVRNNITVK
jgi:hypothetical protein